MEQTLNDFQVWIQAAWEMFGTQFTIYGWTISFRAIFLFAFLCSFLIMAVKILFFGGSD